MSDDNITLGEIYGGDKEWYKKRKTLFKNKDPETYKLIGLAMEVYNNIGQGFLEAVYQEAFEIELQENEIDYEREKKLEISYKKKILHTFYKADFVCMNKIIIELKSIKKITNIEEVQVINYLKASGFNKGLIFNFGAPSLEFKRYIN